MEKVYKGMMGYKPETEKNDATHIVLTLAEWDKVQSDIRALQAQYDTEVNSLRKTLDKTVQNSNESLTEAQKKLDSAVRQAKAEIRRLNNLNKNLLRISKERANAKRGLTPKKEHNGYVLLDSTEYTYSIRHSKKPLKINAWKVRIQSFYDATIPFETIKKNVANDLLSVFGSGLGVSCVFNNGQVDEMGHDDLKKLFSENVTFVFKTSYKQNFKSGFWEIEYLVNKNIKVPESMLLSK